MLYQAGLILSVALIGLIVYYALRRYAFHRGAVAWLVAMSLAFYGWFNPFYLVSLIGSILFNYAAAGLMATATAPSRRKLLLAAGIIANLGLLGYFKYAHFFVDNLNSVFGTDFNLHKIVLPLAISFYTIQQIAYLVDTYRSQIPERNLLNYLLFVTFFPKLIAGPIVRYAEMFPRPPKDPNTYLNRDDIVVGLSVFLIGAFKKVILAEGVALYANAVFGTASIGTDPTFASAWVGALAYSLQLYFDFSGYCDMAIGLGLMIGYRLPLNFYSPYKALDPVDFWHRWHVTLSRFLRDYVYIPLGGNRKGERRRNINLLLTMAIAGLWHGAGLTFVIWGALHGAYLVLGHRWRSLQQSLHWNTGKMRSLLTPLSVLITFVAVTAAWVFFRADSVGTATEVLAGMFGFNGVSFALSVGAGAIIWISALLVLCWFAPNSLDYMANYRPTVDSFGGPPAVPKHGWLRWSPTLRGATVIAVLTVLAVLGLTQVTRFIYAQF